MKKGKYIPEARLTNILKTRESELGSLGPIIPQQMLDKLAKKKKRKASVRTTDVIGTVKYGREDILSRQLGIKGQADMGESDPRPVAVGFYLALLKTLLENGGDGLGVQMRVAANRVYAPWPECVACDSILHEAAHQIAEHQNKKWTPDDFKTFERFMMQYLGRVLFERLRDARIFQFKEHDYRQLYHNADVHVTQSAGFEWEPYDAERRTPENELKAVAEFSCKEGAKVPFPEKLPFRSCYLAWGTGIGPSLVQCNQYGLDDSFHLVMATLISSDGWVFTIVMKGNKDTVGFAVSKNSHILGGMKPVIILERIGEHTHGDIAGKYGDRRIVREMEANGEVVHDEIFNPGWTLPYDMVPWMVSHVIEVIEANDSLTKVQPGLLSERGKYKALSKRTGQTFTPAPYYTVLIQPTTYKEIEQRIKSQPREWTHQWDVIGHYGHKIQRGTLPINPKVLKDLLKRGYWFFNALNRPTPEVVKLLMDRRLPPWQHGEWIAVLKFWRDNFIKGPPDKPYIPSVHKLKRGMPD